MSKSKSQTQSKSEKDIKIATFRTSGGSMIFIPYSDPASLERILEGVKKLREESKEEEKE
jgi:hypothetical protein